LLARFCGLVLVLLRLCQPKHRLACFWVLAIGQTERLAAQTKFGRVGVRQRAALCTVLVLKRDRRKAVPGDQNLGVDVALEAPVPPTVVIVLDGDRSERRRHRITGPPDLHCAVVDGITEEV
jgi:hypothetical protein